MTKQVLGASALALLIGFSTFTLNTALAQNGGDARSNEREMKKTLDDRELTPIRPIRRVGDENWPAAKDQPATGETSGEASNTETKKGEPAKQDEANQDSKQEPAKQETAKQDKPTPTAKPGVKPQDSAQNKAAAPNKDAAQKAPDQKTEKGFASIRLGTDESGRVAVNEAQERQIASALRKQRIDTVNVKVSVGSVAPANVRQAAVSSELVDVLPQFRGYNYFATREEIVIVAPSTRKVVAMIPVKLTATASRPSEERTTQTEIRRADTKKTVKPCKTIQRDLTVSQSDGIPSREEILAAPVIRGPVGTAVTRSYRTYRYEEPYDDDVVIIERRPRFYRTW